MTNSNSEDDDRELDLDLDGLKEAPLPDHSSLEKEKVPGFSIPFWGKVVVACIVVFLGAIGYLRTHNQHAENAADVQGSPSDVPEASKRKAFPDITLVTQSGPSKKISDFKGHVVLVSFWATWCTPCLIELPSFIDLHNKLHDQGLEIIPVNVDEADKTTSYVGDFWKTKKFPFPTFFDPTKAASEALRIDSLPSNFVLDKQGRLVAQGYGANDWSADTAVNFIQALLKE